MSPSRHAECSADLARIPLLERLSPAELVRIASLVRSRHYSRGATIFSRGDPADGLFMLLEGAVKLYRMSPDGRQQVLHLVRPPDTFADAAVFAGRAFPAFAEAVEPCTCLVLPRTDLLDLLAEHPDLSMHLLASMSVRLQHFARLIEDLSLREVSARLARYLLEEAERVGRRRFRLPVSKGDLAEHLGTTAETLSRTFSRFRDQGVLDTRGRTVHLLEQGRLSAIVES